jgi:hypothetical protein
MEYGLRRYEAIQRLLWFFFFILCLGVANFTQSDSSYPPAANVQLKDMKTLRFWTGMQGILPAPPPAEVSKGKLDQSEVAPGLDAKKQTPVEKKAPQVKPVESAQTQRDVEGIGRFMIFLIRAGVLFLLGKLLWLMIQHLARYGLTYIMSESVKSPAKVRLESKKPISPESIFPRQLLLDKIRRVPLYFLFHPFQRLRLMLSGSQKSVSSEELIEKERRIVDTDWQILYNSWGPLRWLSWILPALALAQTAWLVLLQVHVASTTQKELLDSIQSIPVVLLPLAQIAGVVLFFKLASGLLRRMEELYLSNLDALLFDRLLSKLPFQSNDTVIILETLQHQFNELSASIKRIERVLLPERQPEKPSGKQP